MEMPTPAPHQSYHPNIDVDEVELILGQNKAQAGPLDVEDEVKFEEWLAPSHTGSPKTEERRPEPERKVSDTFGLTEEHLQKFPAMEHFLEEPPTDHLPSPLPLDSEPAEYPKERLTSPQPVDHWTNSPSSFLLRNPLPDTPGLHPRMTLFASPSPAAEEHDEDDLPPDSYNTTVHEEFDDATDVEDEGDRDYRLRGVIPLGSDDDEFISDSEPLFGAGGDAADYSEREEEEVTTPKQKTTTLPLTPKGLGLRI
jgi:hypothetical protein